MVIPSFGTFAPKPELAQSFLASSRIAQAANQAQAELEIQRARLNQAKVQFEMEQAAKEKVLEQNNLRQMTELSIDNAYKQAMIGLHQRQLETNAALTSQKIATAAAHNQAMEALSGQRTDVTAAHNAAMEAITAGRAEETARHHGALEEGRAARTEEYGRHNLATEALLNKRLEPFVPTSMKVGDQTMYQRGKNLWSFAPQPRGGAIEPSIISALKSDITSLRTQIGKNPAMAKLDPEGYKRMNDRLAAKEAELDQHLKGLSTGPYIPQTQTGTNAPAQVGRFKIITNAQPLSPVDEDEEEEEY